jgi:hypothetical protein
LDPDSHSPTDGTFTSATDGVSFVAQLPPVDTDPLHVKVSVLKGDRWAPMEFYLPQPTAAPGACAPTASPQAP